MSPIAKLFTVLNVVLAGLFLGLAAHALSTEASFKKQFEEEVVAHKKDKEALGADKSKLAADKAELEKARDAMQTERDAAKADIDRLKGQVADQERQNNEMRGSVEKISKSIDELVAGNKALTDAKEKAAQAQRDAEKARDDAVAARAAAEGKAGDLEGKLHTAENSIADLEKSSTELKKNVDSLNTQLASLSDYTGAKLGDFTPMPQIEGRVLDVAMQVEPGLIAINKGEADGVKRGFTFEIYDGKTYKGQVRVEYVHPNSCSALLVRPVPGQKIRQGDSASTRI
jgi:hypothetical protein